MRRHKLAVYDLLRSSLCFYEADKGKGDLDSGWDLNSTRIFMYSEQDDQWIPGDGSIPCGRPKDLKRSNVLRPNHARAMARA